MKVHVFVEGKSDKVFLDAWINRAFQDHDFEVHPHQGKGSLPDDITARPDPLRRGLLDMLPAKLRAYASDPQDNAVLVLVDADGDNCENIIAKLTYVLESLDPRPNVIFKLAVEETEAFYLGDLRALRAAFPDADMTRARAYVPDSICGTAELFGEIVGDPGLHKVTWAEKMGPKMGTTISSNRSPSFRALCIGIQELTQPPIQQPNKKKTKYRHAPRTSPSRRER